MQTFNKLLPNAQLQKRDIHSENRNMKKKNRNDKTCTLKVNNYKQVLTSR